MCTMDESLVEVIDGYFNHSNKVKERLRKATRIFKEDKLRAFKKHLIDSDMMTDALYIDMRIERISELDNETRFDIIVEYQEIDEYYKSEMKIVYFIRLDKEYDERSL